MKSISRKFNMLKERNPGWSSCVCFAGTIMNQQISRKTLEYWFNKLVEKGEYIPKEKKQIVSYLWSITKHPEDGIKSGVIGPREGLSASRMDNSSSNQNNA